MSEKGPQDEPQSELISPPSDGLKPENSEADGNNLNELKEETCLRYGVFCESTQDVITESQFKEELEVAQILPFVQHILVEQFPNPAAPPIEANYCFARIYFTTVEMRNCAAAEMNVPLRKHKWRLTTTQCLPIKPVPEPLIVGNDPFVPFFYEGPSDTVVVDTQEGYVAFATEELCHSKGGVEFMEAKRSGRLIRRLICKHFDAGRRMTCRYGVQCSFVHIQKEAMERTLTTVSRRSQLRFPVSGEDAQTGNWNYERRRDTLVLRNLSPEYNIDDVIQMFSGCAGYQYAEVKVMREQCSQYDPPYPNTTETAKGGQHRYAIIRFDTPENALQTLTETYDADLALEFYGALEDCRLIQMGEAKANGFRVINTKTATHVTLAPDKITDIERFNNYTWNGRPGFQNSNPGSQFQSNDKRRGMRENRGDEVPKGMKRNRVDPPAERNFSGNLPFPPLPSGWGYDVSRRTGEYYFFEEAKEGTTWRHPITNDRYSSRHEERL